MIVCEAIKSLSIVPKWLNYIVCDVLLSFNIKEQPEVTVNFLKSSALDKEGQEKLAIRFEDWVNLPKVVVLIWVVEEALNVKHNIYAKSRHRLGQVLNISD
jgi:hypothetical protein